jgi:hypothetical protein
MYDVDLTGVFVLAGIGLGAIVIVIAIIVGVPFGAYELYQHLSVSIH